MRTVGFICLFVLASASAAAAEEPPPPPNVDSTAVDEMSAMIDNIQARIDKMNDAAGERDSTIEFLNRQIEQAIGSLTSRQDENLALRQKTSELTAELDFAATTRGELDAEVSRVTRDRDRIFTELDAQVQAFADLLALEQEATARLRKDLETRTAELQATLDEKEAFGQELALVDSTRYRIVVRDASGETATPFVDFDVAPSGKKGFLKVAQADRRYFEFDDGALFRGMGVQMPEFLTDPISRGRAYYAEAGSKGLNFGRIWISSVFGTAWNPYLGGRNQYRGYLPVTGLVPLTDEAAGSTELTCAWTTSRRAMSAGSTLAG